MAKTKKKNYTLVVLFVLLIGISVGYAAFGQALTISGTASANGNFKLAFTTANVDPAVGANGTATIVGDTLSITMDLQHPGAGGVVNATIKNTGSIDAKLNDIVPEGLEDNNITVSFAGTEAGEIIKANEEKNITVTVKWNEESKTAKDLTFKIVLNYVQATNNFNTNTTTSENTTA